MASEGAAQSEPPEAPTEVAATVGSPAGLDAATMASEGVAQSAPPAVQAVAPRAGWMEEDMAEGSLVIMTVVGRTRRGPPLALLLGGGRSPTRGEPPL